ncbi:hypothetical protein [Prauserella rugosa]|uniref:CNNM transmembrane domain-containing protein n=1 Tax=Prauserella rugosa TaxID=43354 RepID=A0A660CN18_9PSEU|nr:hypothetical protein [Prauserella rugosa]TWH22641.1 hypothetical protein JD82_04530 [Prauserella rugosa]
MIWALSLLLGIVVILAVIAANGYFVAQEFAYMAVDRSRLAPKLVIAPRSVHWPSPAVPRSCCRAPSSASP